MDAEGSCDRADPERGVRQVNRGASTRAKGASAGDDRLGEWLEEQRPAIEQRPADGLEDLRASDPRQERSQRAPRVQGGHAKPHEIGDAARLVLWIERGAVMLLLAEDVSKGRLEVVLVGDRTDARAIERDAVRDAPTERAGGVVREGRGPTRVGREQHVQVGVGEPKDEEASGAALLVDDRSDLAALGSRSSDGATVMEAQHDVMSERRDRSHVALSTIDRASFVRPHAEDDEHGSRPRWAAVAKAAAPLAAVAKAAGGDVPAAACRWRGGGVTARGTLLSRVGGSVTLSRAAGLREVAPRGTNAANLAPHRAEAPKRASL
jgi:hypothetical protein